MTKTQEFLAIVDCRPEEVKDIPPGRRWSNPPKRQPLFVGGMKLEFGMHKGKHLSEVPRNYLEWLIEQEPSTAKFAAVQDEVRRFIGK